MTPEPELVGYARRLYGKYTIGLRNVVAVLGVSEPAARKLMAGARPSNAKPRCRVCGKRRAVHKVPPVWRCDRCFQGGRLG